ncbi:MAG: polyphosphate kinase (could be polyphosphate AMP phosphotransferase (pap)), partial [Arsenicicoccus sp.]
MAKKSKKSKAKTTSKGVKGTVEAPAPVTGKAPKGKGSGKAQGKASKSTESKNATPKNEVAAKAAPAGGTSYTEALRVGEGVVLADLDPRSTPAFDGDKQAGKEALAAADAELDTLQEQLYAESRAGGRKRVLLVVQGMDTSGKGGIMRHVVGAVDPQGVELTAFKAPTAEEKKHPFLWRIRQALPGPGMIGVFDRSHYEDVLIVRVHDLVPPGQWRRRYATINAFEEKLAADGVTIIKVMLHISPQEQKARLAERLERPDKHWKFNPGDLDEREFWPDYQEAYQALLERCSTQHAPWFVVPADRKWYARLAVQQL